MGATVISRTKKSFKIEIEIPYASSLLMLDAEELVQKYLNKGGVVATREVMEKHDTDGRPITVCGQKLTSKGKECKKFESPYGSVDVDRYVYQSSSGGKTYVPVDIGCRIINTSTPKFAKMVSSNYSCDAAPGVQRNLAENHNRPVAQSFIKNITDAVGAIAVAKEESWSYEIPSDLPKAVKSISIGLDGTCLNMMEDGWREAMCGTIALFDRNGERMHTIYIGASPEYGKETFFKRFSREIERVTELYPKVPIVGLADGAATNWIFLAPKVDILTIDFWHVSEYLAKASKSMYPRKSQQNEREEWLEEACHRLKHKVGGATRILNELILFDRENKITVKGRKELKSAITYLTNNKNKMIYHKNVNTNLPIGSGVTEAACKTLVKQRMCKGAARWKDQGATVVLTLRSMHLTNSRWEQFWNKYSQDNYQIAS